MRVGCDRGDYINYSQASTKDPVDGKARSESNIIINASLLSDNIHKQRQRCYPFRFGSNALAIIYMANTMVIPEMNQVVDEIEFSSIKMLVVTTLQYMVVLTTLVIPSYMMIQQCERANSPFYHQIINKVSPRLSSFFLKANMTINILALFNLIVKLLDYLMRSAPCMYVPFNLIIGDIDDFKFLLVWFVYFFVGIIVHFILQHNSYFENFYQIQGRLLLTFFSKWLIFISVFVIISIQKECHTSYINQPTKRLDSANLTYLGVANYYTNVLYCLSFPFVEVFFIKRETATHAESSFKNSKYVFKAQFILRGSFFFMQICGWGILYQLAGEDTLNCNQQLGIQILMMVMMLLTITTVAPIYANNYALNKQMVNDEHYVNNKDKHLRYISEAYNYSAAIFAIIFLAVAILRFVTSEYWEIRYQLVRITQSLQGLCFGLTCIGMPIYIQSEQVEHPHKKLALQLLTGVALIVFAAVFICPWLDIARV